ncbi:MAG TPA: hypothetical protein VK524_05515 [Polyangiaceae bacterium]|nr:hypothetical protein [Polyangiaceae bacterium]
MATASDDESRQLLQKRLTLVFAILSGVSLFYALGDFVGALVDGAFRGSPIVPLVTAQLRARGRSVRRGQWQRISAGRRVVRRAMPSGRKLGVLPIVRIGNTPSCPESLSPCHSTWHARTSHHPRRKILTASGASSGAQLPLSGSITHVTSYSVDEYRGLSERALPDRNMDRSRFEKADLVIGSYDELPLRDLGL